MGPCVRRDDTGGDAEVVQKLESNACSPKPPTTTPSTAISAGTSRRGSTLRSACCDRHADGHGASGADHLDEDGTAQRTSFDDISEMSRRFANVLRTDGLKPGDRVAVFLSQSLELPVAHLAAFRSGLVSVPLFTLFGEDALEFRLQNLRAPGPSSPMRPAGRKLTKIRDRLPGSRQHLSHRRSRPLPAPNRSGRR